MKNTNSEKISIIEKYLEEGNTYSKIISTTEYQGYPIGKWIYTWRTAYKKGTLDQSIMLFLKNLGETFEAKQGESIPYDKKIEIIKAYLKEGNIYSEIKSTTEYQEYPIGVWINVWRTYYHKGILNAEIEQELRSLGEVFERKEQMLTEQEKITIIKEYINEGHSYSDIKATSEYKGYPIGVWKNKWRRLNKKGKLKKEYKQELISLGEDFEVKRSENVDNSKKIAIIKEYLKFNDYEEIKWNTEYNNYPIGIWISTWRTLYNQEKLDSQTEQELKNIGETFEAKRSEKMASSEKIAIIKEYISLGHKYSAIDKPVTYKEYPLGSWIIEWRSKYNNGTLNEQTEQSLRDLGETFERKVSEFMTVDEKLTVIKKYLSLGKEYNQIKSREVFEEYPIGNWVNHWRRLYNQGVLDKGLEQTLRSLGENFERKMGECISDDEKIKIISDYLSLNNTYNSINKNTIHNDYKIGIWILTWRNSYRQGTLKTETEQALRSLGETFEYKRVRNLKVNPAVLEKDNLKLTDENITDPKAKTKHL